MVSLIVALTCAGVLALAIVGFIALVPADRRP
jgi:hypothetical protein